jgi:two-component system nitrate/nitrite response regulator NarL
VFHRGAAEVVIRALTHPPPPQVVAGLTPREVDVLRLLSGGLSNAVIAERLGVSAKTVRNQVSAVLAKIGVSSRQAAAEWARGAGV